MIFASLIAKLGFDTQAWTAGKNKAVSELNDFEGKQKTALQRIKGSFGRGSEISQWTKLLYGGGAVGAGIVMVGKKIHELADEWMGVSKAAEAAAEAQKNAISVANAAHAGKREGEKFDEQLAKQLRKAREQNLLSGAVGNPELQAEIKNNAHNADLDDQLATYKEKVADLKDDAEQAQKEINAYNERIKEEKAALRDSKIGAHGDAHLFDAASEAVFKTHTKALDEAEKLRDAAQQRKQELSSKASGMESQQAEIARKINEIKQYDAITTANEQFEAEKKAHEESAKDAIDAEKKKQAVIKRLRKDSLEDQKTAIEENIKKIEDAKQQQHGSAEVSEIRGGKQIVIGGSVPEDPNTAILKQQKDLLKGIETQLKDLNRQEDEAAETVINF